MSPISHEEDTRQEFQLVLKEALNLYYPYWQTSNRRGRLIELPDTETLRAWTETDQHPQAKTFEEFLRRSPFPEQQKRHLETLYQQLPRRRHGRTSQPEVHNSPQQPERISKLWTVPYIVVICTCLLLTVGVLFVILYNTQQNRTKVWCTTLAFTVQDIGGSSLLYFDAALPLQDFNDTNFYIYFDTNEYISNQVVSSQKLDTVKHKWVFTISPEWVQSHPQWVNPLLWHIEYQC